MAFFVLLPPRCESAHDATVSSFMTAASFFVPMWPLRFRLYAVALMAVPAMGLALVMVSTLIFNRVGINPYGPNQSQS